MTSQLISVQAGRASRYKTGGPGGGEWSSAIAKMPVSGAVKVGRLGLSGDDQVDRENHGGEEKAVLAYAATHYPRWREELGDGPVEPGAFGENFTVNGMDEASVCLGDVYLIGAVRLEVSQPRQPCWKLASRWNVPDLVKRTLETNRTGWYLRVMEGGTVEAGATIERIARPHADWTVAAMNEAMHGRVERARLAALARIPQLSVSWRRSLEKRLG